jgi:hypothetical protein
MKYAFHIVDVFSSAPVGGVEGMEHGRIRDAKSDAQPSARSIDSIQIVHAHGRFWVASLVFDHERSGAPLPATYLKEAGL